MYNVQCTKTQRHTHTLCVYARIERNIEWLDGEKKNGIQHRIGIESSKKKATKIYRTAKNVNVDWWLTCATPFGVSTFINFNIIFCYTSFYYVIRFAYIFCFYFAIQCVTSHGECGIFLLGRCVDVRRIIERKEKTPCTNYIIYDQFLRIVEVFCQRLPAECVLAACEHANIETRTDKSIEM